MHLENKIQHEQYEELVSSFIQLHKTQFQALGLPEIYWRDLCMKLKDEIFDAGNFFQLRQRVDEDNTILGYKAVCITGLSKNDPTGVFLVDHAWTYRVNEARTHLQNSPSLLNRMCDLMHIDISATNGDVNNNPEERDKSLVDAVYENMWKHNQHYKLSTNFQKMTDEEREPIWYVMDEFGSSVRHNDSPNVRCVPFLFMPSNVMFSLIWPIEDIPQGAEVTRDYAHGIEDETMRACKLIPWIEDIEDEDYEFDEGDPTQLEEPDMEYFTSGRKEVILADESKFSTESTDFPADMTTINVFTDYEMVKQFLSDERFQFVDDIEQAHVRWLSVSCKNYKELQEKYPTQLISNFAYEENLTCKDMLAVASRRVEGSKNWLPLTYNLNSELSKFISYWKQREDEGLPNLWIIKPWNLCRTVDITITSNLNQIIRCQETGPKIACKYIENPVLFKRGQISVKFDLRYHVMLKSVAPLKLYAWKCFSIRFGNKQFELKNFNDYQTHFTAMNYRGYDNLLMKHSEFIPEFEKQNPEFKWAAVEAKCFKMFRHMFEGGCKEQAPKGLVHNPQSRAMYGIDLMLEWREGNSDIEPMVCEVNYMPDCKRPCMLNPEFYNTVFNCLYTDGSLMDNLVEI